jgi:RHS repeat-associated protein
MRRRHWDGHKRGHTRAAAVAIGVASTVAASLIWVTFVGAAEPNDNYQTAVATDGPGAQYRLDESVGAATLADSAGTDTATVTGITLGSSGPFGGSKAGSFNGEAYATLGTTPLASANEFTAEAWVNWAGNALYKQPIFDFGSSANSYMYLTPASAATGHPLTFEIHPSTGAALQLTATKLGALAWHYVAVTETSSGTLTIYVDGQQVAQSTGASVFPSTLGTTTGNLLGKSVITGDPLLKGSLSNVAFYRKALSASRALAHYYAAEVPVNTAAPSISGLAQDGQTLTGKAGTWTGLAPITLGYQWTRCDATGVNCENIPSATTEKYTVASGDVGATVRITLTASNAAGSGSATSAPTAKIEPLAPTNTAAPSIVGEARDEAMLTASSGTWKGTPPISYTYHWETCSSSGTTCKWITGATSTTYHIVSSEIGKTLRVEVSAENAAGKKNAWSEVTPIVLASPPINTTVPSISGTAREGQQLTATTGEWRGTANLAYAYQWLRCTSLGEGCLPIAGATTSTYLPQASDVGNTISVVVTATNVAGEASASSTITGTIAAAPPADTSPPTVTGTPRYAETLTASTGAWSGTPPLSYGYQWRRCNAAGAECANIASATNAAYVPNESDIGARLDVLVTAQNTAGEGTAASAATQTVAPDPPTNAKAPAIEGTTQDGHTLTATAGEWTGAPSISFAYQWQRCDSAGGACADLEGATGTSYLLGLDDVWSTVRVIVTATHPGGSATSSSEVSPLVVPAPPAVTSIPTVSGTAVEGQTLTASTGSWTGTPPLAYSYQWEDCDSLGVSCMSIPDATSATYQLQSSDVNSKVEVLVGASNFAGAASAASSPSAVVALAEPVNFVAPAITGIPRVGQTLTASAGEWTGTPSMSYAYQWELCNATAQECAEVPGATGTTFDLTSADLGRTIMLAITATNPSGGTTATSLPTAVVAEAPTPPENLEEPSISGNLTEGQTLTISTGVWSGTQPMSYRYEWERCGENEAHCQPIEERVCERLKIGEAEFEEVCESVPVTQNTYVLEAGDVGYTIRAIVVASNPIEGEATAYRAEPVDGPGPPANRTLPFIEGYPDLGERLTAAPGGWAGSRPFTYSYQWQRCNTKGESCTAIAGATASSYLFGSEDVGYTLRVIVTATNGMGSASATSGASNTLTNNAWSAGWDSRAPGADPAHPTFSHGPVTVSLISGNVMVAFPGPSFPSENGSIGMSAAWNSLPPQPVPTCVGKGCTPPPDYSISKRESPLGGGMTLNAGEAGTRRPLMLIDHNDLSGQARFNAIEVVYGDGGDEYFRAVGDHGTRYVQEDLGGTPTESGAALTKNPSPGTATPAWTLQDADGLTSTFAQTNSETGGALVTSAQVAAPNDSAAKITYTYSAEHAGLLTSISDASGRALVLDWHLVDPTRCPDALLCVTGPDGRTWRYVGDGTGGSSGTLVRVNNGVRDVMAFENNTIYSADDLDPAHASPGYNPEHHLTIKYCAEGESHCPPGAVDSIIDSGVSSGSSSTSPTWSFLYGGQSTYKTYTGAQAKYLMRLYNPKSGGPPTRLGGGEASYIWIDAKGHVMETRAANNLEVNWKGFQSAYNAAGQLLSSETPSGSQTTNTYDPGSGELTKTEGPQRSDGSRPVTSYRYDEQAMGNVSTPGRPLLGLRAAYYANPSLAGIPAKIQTDPVSGSGAAVNYDWRAAGPTALNGQREDFSVSWSGVLADLGPGTYAFSVTADDGVVLLIDEKPVIEDTRAVGARTLKAEVTLAAGSHRIELQYLQKRDEPRVALSWTPPGGSAALLEASVARPAYGNRTSTVSPTGHVSFSHYADPASGRPDYTVAAAGTLNYVTSYRYDALGRTIEKDMPKANAARAIEPDGTLAGAADPRFTTKYFYYAPSATAAPPAACPSSPAVNQGGLLQTVSTYGETPKTTVYDSSGRALALTGAAGTDCTSYDAEGRVISERIPRDAPAPACPDPAATACYVYDPASLKRSATNAAGTITLRYDEMGRVVSSVQSAGPNTLSEAALGYDEDSNLTNETVAAGPLNSSTTFTTRYTYNAGDQQTGTKDPVRVRYDAGAGEDGLYQYDEAGYRLITQEYPTNNTFAYYTYDNAGSLTGVYNRHGAESEIEPPENLPEDSKGSPIADYAYQYDPEERQTQNTLSGGGLTTTTESYGYDAAGRLSSVTLPDGTENAYSYDPDSNRTSESQTPPAGPQNVIQSLAYDPASTPGVDQLSSSTTNGDTTKYGYTGDGEVSSRGPDALRWDGAGSLLGGTFAGTSVSYTLDALGRLQQRATSNPATTSRYLYAGASETPFAQTDGTGTVTSFAVLGPMGPIKVFEGAPATQSVPYRMLYYDAHGNRVAEADKNGTRTALTSYDAFGTPTPAPAASALTYGYVGRYQRPLDTQSGLILMGARPYEPAAGRFLATDPIEGGSANAYDYANGDPVNGEDPNGTCPFDGDIRPPIIARGGFTYIEICGTKGKRAGKRVGYLRVNSKTYDRARAHSGVSTGERVVGGVVGGGVMVAGLGAGILCAAATAETLEGPIECAKAAAGPVVAGGVTLWGSITGE